MNEYIEKSMSYAEYTGLIDRLLAEGKTTGPKQSEAMLQYATLNRQRMKRIGKTTELNEPLRALARGNSRKMIWLIITEGWCGDAAQSIPVIERIADEADNIETRYLLRDDHPELMDDYLTNGARSIPKLIALDAETLVELFTWGPRPQKLTDYFNELRSEGTDKSAISEKLQRWYNEDRSGSIRDEFETLLRRTNAVVTNAANR